MIIQNLLSMDPSAAIFILCCGIFTYYMIKDKENFERDL